MKVRWRRRPVRRGSWTPRGAGTGKGPGLRARGPGERDFWAGYPSHEPGRPGEEPASEIRGTHRGVCAADAGWGGTRRAGGRPGTNPAATNSLRPERRQLGQVLETFPDPSTETRAFGRGLHRLFRMEAGDRTWWERGGASSTHQRSRCVHRLTQYRSEHTHTPQPQHTLQRQPHNPPSTYTITSHPTHRYTRITHSQPPLWTLSIQGRSIRLRLLVSLSDSPTLLRSRLFCLVLFSKEKGGFRHRTLIWAAESGRRGTALTVGLGLGQ